MSTSPEPIEIVTPQPGLPGPCPTHRTAYWRPANASSAPDPSTSGSAAPADSARLRQFCSTRCRVAQHRFDHSG